MNVELFFTAWVVVRGEFDGRWSRPAGGRSPQVTLQAETSVHGQSGRYERVVADHGGRTLQVLLYIDQVYMRMSL